MSIRDALEFIQLAYRDENVRASIAELDPQDDLNEIVTLANDLGLVFSADELRTAFATDWNMRRFFYNTERSNNPESVDQNVP